MDLHISRTWRSGTSPEDDCPCPKAACGLIVTETVDPACPHHSAWQTKTIRRKHSAEQCPGVTS